MKKLLIIFLLTVTFAVPLLAVSGSASAVDIFQQCQGSAKNTDVCQDVGTQANNNSNNPIIRILKAALEIVSWVAGIAAIILILISGMKFITAGGGAEGAKSAKGHLTNAIIGIVVLVIAQGILALAISRAQ